MTPFELFSLRYLWPKMASKIPRNFLLSPWILPTKCHETAFWGRTPVWFLKRSNPGHAFGTSEARLTLLWCHLSRILTAGIVERADFALKSAEVKKLWYVRCLTEYGSLIIRFAMVVVVMIVLAYSGTSVVWLSLEGVRLKWVWQLCLEIMFYVV